MNISQWKIGNRTIFSLEVDDRLLLADNRVSCRYEEVIDTQVSTLELQTSKVPEDYAKTLRDGQVYSPPVACGGATTSWPVGGGMSHPEPVRQLQLAASCAICYRELSVNPAH